MPQAPQFFQLKHFSQGQVIFREGQDASYACIVNDGEVDVFKEVGGQRMRLAKLGRGAVFGEMALIGNDKRTATVVAATYTEVVILERQRFQKTLETSNPLLQSLLKSLVERLAHTNSMLLACPEPHNKLLALAHLIEALAECAQADDLGRARLPLKRAAGHAENILGLAGKELERLLLQLAALGPLSMEHGPQGRELALETPSKLSIKARNLLEKGGAEMRLPPESGEGLGEEAPAQTPAIPLDAAPK